MIEEVTEMS